MAKLEALAGWLPHGCLGGRGSFTWKEIVLEQVSSENTILARSLPRRVASGQMSLLSGSYKTNEWDKQRSLQSLLYPGPASPGSAPVRLISVVSPWPGPSEAFPAVTHITARFSLVQFSGDGKRFSQSGHVFLKKKNFDIGPLLLC